MNLSRLRAKMEPTVPTREQALAAALREYRSYAEHIADHREQRDRSGASSPLHEAKVALILELLEAEAAR